MSEAYRKKADLPYELLGFGKVAPEYFEAVGRLLETSRQFVEGEGFWRNKVKHLCALMGMAGAKLCLPVSEKDLRDAKATLAVGPQVLLEILREEKGDPREWTREGREILLNARYMFTLGTTAGTRDMANQGMRPSDLDSMAETLVGLLNGYAAVVVVKGPAKMYAWQIETPVDRTQEAAYTAPHDLRTPRLTLPVGYFGDRDWPDMILVSDFAVLPDDVERDSTGAEIDHDHPNTADCVHVGAGVWKCGVTDQH